MLINQTLQVNSFNGQGAWLTAQVDFLSVHLYFLIYKSMCYSLLVYRK